MSKKTKRSGFKVMMRLIGMVKPMTGFMVLSVIMGLIGNICATYIPVLGGFAILNVLGVSKAVSVKAAFILMLVFAVVRGGLRYAEQGCNHYIAFRILALMRHRVFQSLRKLAPAKLEGKDRGDLINLITSDIELLEVFYAHTISPICIATLFTIVMCVFIGQFSWILALLALAAYLLIGVIIPLIVSKASGDNGLEFRNQSGDLGTYVLDSLRGLSEIIQYGRGEERKDEMVSRTDALSETQRKMNKTEGRNYAVTNTAIFAADLCMIFVASLLYTKGMITSFAGVLIPTLALMSSFGPTVALANLGTGLQSTFAAGNRVLDIVDEQPQVEEITGKEPVTFSGADVDHVSFDYGGDTILDDVNLEIPDHAFIGITGRSGSGKSTLLKLIMRFWETKQGEISVSGTNVNEINTANLRDMESYVTQETHLFHDSIANNLRIAKLDATQEELEAACKKASVHDFILTLPQGYDTPVGELGDTLSGGEKQRLGLARAFLHDAPLMLLDEPTSNLDSLNEAVILKSLTEAREGRTVLLVSHRKSTMRIVDKEYSVENGRMS